MSDTETPLQTAKAIDPVCGMQVDPARTPHRVEHCGEIYYFCSAGCAARFKADPEHYLASAKAGRFVGMANVAPPRAIAPPPAATHTSAATPPPPGTAVEYFCPMDPEVVSDRPGACPKCGMALEPRPVTFDPAAAAEAIDRP